MDAEAVLEVLARLDPPVWLATARAGSRRSGLIATFVSNASVVPELPRLIVGLADHHYTSALVEESQCMALHLLGEEHLELVWRFGLRSGRDADKFEGLGTAESETGAPLLDDALALVEGHVEASMPTGERTLYLLDIVAARSLREGKPLTIHRLLELAPPERLRELDERMERDRAVDAAAIREWRERRRRSSP